MIHYLLQGTISILWGGFVTIAVATIGAVFVYRADRKMKDAQGDKSKAEASVIVSRGKIDADLDVSKTAMEMAKQAWERLEAEIKKAQSERERSDLLQTELYNVREELYTERHKSKNLEHKIRFLEEAGTHDLEEVKEDYARCQLRIETLEEENKMLKIEIEKCKPKK